MLGDGWPVGWASSPGSLREPSLSGSPELCGAGRREHSLLPVDGEGEASPGPAELWAVLCRLTGSCLGEHLMDGVAAD